MRWEIWQDEYWGLEWNNRHRINVIDVNEIDDVYDELASYFTNEAVPHLEWSGDDEYISVCLLICGECEEIWPCGTHGGLIEVDQPSMLIGYHAIKEEDNVVLS
jgi:hypothetical protein